MLILPVHRIVHRVHKIYINYLETEKAVFLPQFGENLEDKDDEALGVFKNIFREKRKAVIPIKCSELSKGGGVLNCISWN
jgi:agmatine deiminase